MALVIRHVFPFFRGELGQHDLIQQPRCRRIPQIEIQSTQTCLEVVRHQTFACTASGAFFTHSQEQKPVPAIAFAEPRQCRLADDLRPQGRHPALRQRRFHMKELVGTPDLEHRIPHEFQTLVVRTVMFIGIGGMCARLPVQIPVHRMKTPLFEPVCDCVHFPSSFDCR